MTQDGCGDDSSTATATSSWRDAPRPGRGAWHAFRASRTSPKRTFSWSWPAFSAGTVSPWAPLPPAPPAKV